MTNPWTFAETGWTAALALAAAGGLFAFIVVLERRRRSRWSVPRIGASALAVVSLLLLFLRPARTVEAPPAAALLLTRGALPEQLGPSPDEMRFAILPGAERPPSPWVPIPDLAFLARRHPEVDRLRVLGHGLPPWEWDAFQGEVEIGAAAPFDAGVREVAWPRRLDLGRELVVRGVLAGVDGRNGTLRLEGPGGVDDSAALAGGEEVAFELRARPRDTGRFLYRWVLETADDGLRREGALDVVVDEPDPVAVLWLEDAPGFETRHFKAWLSERRGRLAIRSRISRDRFRTELHNLAGLRVSRVDRALLERFDLAVVDGPTLRSLRRSEAEALRAAVDEGGLGLLVLAGSQGPGLDDGWPRFRLDDVEELDEMSVTATWPGVEPLSALVITAREIAPQRGVDPVVLDGSGRLLVASRPSGTGTVGLALLHDSYRWVLEGNPEHHGLYWSRVIAALAKRDDAPARWRLPAGPIFVDEPLELLLETREPAVAGLAARIAAGDGTEEPLTLRQGELEPRHQRTVFWPREAGWHRLGLEGSESLWFYVQDAASWTAWRQARHRDATRRRAVLGAGTRGLRHEGRRSSEEWPRLWLYLALLGAVGFLWVEERWRAVPKE